MCRYGRVMNLWQCRARVDRLWGWPLRWGAAYILSQSGCDPALSKVTAAAAWTLRRGPQGGVAHGEDLRQLLEGTPGNPERRSPGNHSPHSLDHTVGASRCGQVPPMVPAWPWGSDGGLSLCGAGSGPGLLPCPQEHGTEGFSGPEVDLPRSATAAECCLAEPGEGRSRVQAFACVTEVGALAGRGGFLGANMEPSALHRERQGTAQWPPQPQGQIFFHPSCCLSLPSSGICLGAAKSASWRHP